LQGKRKLAEKKFLWGTIQKDRRRRKKIKRVGELWDSELALHPPVFSVLSS
jgi:hypothetical protein